MATKKSDEEQAQEPEPQEMDQPTGPVSVPNYSARPPDVHTDNTTFASRAKGQGSNKRVEQADGK